MSSLAVGTPDPQFGVGTQAVTLVDLLEWRAQSQDHVRHSPSLRAKIARLKQRRRTERRLKAPKRSTSFSQQELEKIAMLLEETDEINEPVE